MSTTVSPPPGPAPTAGRTFALRLTDDPDALMRVLALLRRRRCRVLHVDFVRGDRHRPGRLHVRVAPLGGRPASLPEWLGALPDVLEVRQLRP